jgi:hypothetical protein
MKGLSENFTKALAMYPLMMLGGNCFNFPLEPTANGHIPYDRHSGTGFIIDAVSGYFTNDTEMPYRNLWWLAVFFGTLVLAQFICAALNKRSVVFYTSIVLLVSSAALLLYNNMINYPVTIGYGYYMFMGLETVLIVINYLKKNEPLEQAEPVIEA